MFEGVLNTPVFRLHLVMFSLITANIWWDISNSWLEENLSSFEYFRKTTLITCIQKAWRSRDSLPLSLLIRYNTHPPWIATSTIQTNGNDQHFFIRIPILGHVLVHSVDKTHDLVVTVELIWLLFSNILFFNFVPIPNKSLRFTHFEKAM